MGKKKKESCGLIHERNLKLGLLINEERNSSNASGEQKEVRGKAKQ